MNYKGGTNNIKQKEGKNFQNRGGMTEHFTFTNY